MSRLEFSKSDARKIASAYRKGASILNLAHEWEVSPPVIRRTIESAGVEIRRPGRHKASGSRRAK